MSDGCFKQIEKKYWITEWKGLLKLRLFGKVKDN